MNSLSKLGISAFTALMLVLSIGFATVATQQPAHALEGKVTGNIGIVSKYVFRGFVESDRPAIQGGFDYSHPSGAYAGYWASTLGPSGAGTVVDGSFGGYTQPDGSNTSTEQDFYAGYADSFNGIDYDLGVLQYTYANLDAPIDMTEGYVSLSKGPFSFTGNYALNDGFSTEGDIYYSLSYSTDLVDDLGFSAKAGFFEPDTSGAADGLEDIVVGLSHPIGDSGGSFSLKYIHAEDDLNPGTSNNEVVMGMSYGFDVIDDVSMVM